MQVGPDGRSSFGQPRKYIVRKNGRNHVLNIVTLVLALRRDASNAFE
ncbi:hypothetical protein FOXG_18323 [Fusarium oxysporum f. sp. lycopersici 4287]|uniref:Uncharacterized protein n=1 Tax=Fusarium oxysporum f. sp. lycopersici (strain 4287 / CBS 123668 / FGSC 9935 / NRRL 34936) TaxID=426428 RepID=A0A0J9UGQ9_FUSO4|nr:hypothetical protein FOXG_18323 [Fusarium oxysporum f. sp. lycopersici 4287]KNA98032.1 hypothetical protein FOXG_18323 [Fusarium oxysporum f. sp. lycopersici 4287]